MVVFQLPCFCRIIANDHPLLTCQAPHCRKVALAWEQFIRSVGLIFTGKPELAGDRTSWSQVPLLTFKQAGLTRLKLGSGGREARARFGKNSGNF